jgi:hypothetical protein
MEFRSWSSWSLIVEQISSTHLLIGNFCFIFRNVWLVVNQEEKKLLAHRVIVMRRMKRIVMDAYWDSTANRITRIWALHQRSRTSSSSSIDTYSVILNYHLLWSALSPITCLPSGRWINLSRCSSEHSIGFIVEGRIRDFTVPRPDKREDYTGLKFIDEVVWIKCVVKCYWLNAMRVDVDCSSPNELLFCTVM